MDVSQIQKFISESIQQQRTWKRIRLLGGEPFVHKDLESIVYLLMNYKESDNPDVAIEVITNGYGTALEPQRNELVKIVHLVNTYKQSASGNKFDSFNMAPRDDWRFALTEYTNACWIPSECGIGLTPFGYYHCAIAGGIDRILGFDIGLKKMPLLSESFTKLKRKLCPWCGHFQVGSHQSSKLKTPLDSQNYSRSWKKAYLAYGLYPRIIKRY